MIMFETERLILRQPILQDSFTTATLNDVAGA